MKLSDKTTKLLKNFSSINNSILLVPGNTIFVSSHEDNFCARAKIEEEIPVEVPIYDFSTFLAVLSMFKEPVCSFRDKYVLIQQGKHCAHYRYSDKTLLKHRYNYDKTQNFLNNVAHKIEYKTEFEMSQASVSALRRAQNIMNLGNTKVFTKEGFVIFEVYDGANSSLGNYVIETEQKSSVEFSAEFSLKEFLAIEDDYAVKVGDMNLLFEGKNVPVNYWLSTYDAVEFGE